MRHDMRHDITLTLPQRGTALPQCATALTLYHSVPHSTGPCICSHDITDSVSHMLY